MKRTLSLLAAFALAMTAFTPAHADESETSDYTITLSWQEAPRVESVTLDCDPVGGTHPDPEQACELLEEAGSVAALQGPGDACPDIWDPVVATVEGNEYWSQSYDNPCRVTSDKGPFFAIL